MVADAFAGTDGGKPDRAPGAPGGEGRPPARPQDREAAGDGPGGGARGGGPGRRRGPARAGGPDPGSGGAGAGWDAYVPARNAANVRAFDEFVARHAGDPEFKGKYAAFVHGKLQKVGESEDALVEEMRRKFGYVKMCVGEVTADPRVMRIESPELA